MGPLVSVTATTNLLAAMVTCDESISRSSTSSICRRSAEMNTSALAPSSICARNRELPAKCVSIRTPSFSASNAAAASVSASVSDEAANTRSVTVSSGWDEAQAVVIVAASNTERLSMSR